MELEKIDDRVAAAAFRRLVVHLRQREDAANIDLMGLAGFCRNCLADWLAEAGELDRDQARLAIYGEAYDAWKARQPAATPAQLDQLQVSLAKNR
jgi:uncharacterized protein